MTLEDAIEALRTLQARPGLYQAMADKELERCADFSAPMAVRRWERSLFDVVPASFERWQRGHWALKKPIRATKFVWRALRHRWARRKFFRLVQRDG